MSIRHARLLFPLTALMIAPVATAQAADRTLPRAAHGAWGNATYSKGPTLQQFRIQNWYSSDNVPIGTVITAVALRGRRNTTSAAYSCNLTVTMENTTRDFVGMGGTLASNLSPAAVVAFATKPVSFAAANAPQDPFDARNQWVTLDTPFVFTGPNLIIELRETQRVSSGHQHYDGLNQPNVSVHRLASHAACGGAIAANYQSANGVYSLTAGSAALNAPLWFMLGFENVHAAGLGLPLDLTPFGLPGCVLGLDPFGSIAATTDNLGTAQIHIALPLPARSLQLSAQAAHLDAATGSQLVTSTTVHSVLGNTGMWTQVPSFDGSNAITGYPRNYNSGPVLLIR